MNDETKTPPQGATENAPAVQEPKRQLTKAEGFKNLLASKYMKSMENAFGNDKEALKFLSAVSNAVQKTPKLLDCDNESLMNAIMCCVACKIYPNTPSGEAYLIPYGKQVQFQLGYKGVVTLMYRAGVSSIFSGIVRENDEFDYELGLEPKLVHKPNMSGDRGKATAVYVVATLNGEKVYYVMSESEIMKIKEFSQSAKSSNSPWNERSDPQLNMWRKTALKQLAKLLPSNNEIAVAIEQDTQQDLAPKKSDISGVNVTTDLND